MENTYRALEDCYDNWEKTESESELKYRERILKVCKKIVENYEKGGE